MLVKVINITPDCETVIEKACRNCYQSEENEQTRRQFIESVIKRGHESVIEHATATFEIRRVSRALTHQLVRHRIASYSQRSQRYVNEKQFDYIIPESIETSKNPMLKERYHMLMNQIQSAYEVLSHYGVKKEDARFVLPNACCTDIIVTMNFRALRNFFRLRCDKHAQWEIRKLALTMLEILYNEAPSVFGDLKEQYL
jgi:thymidylate synthase (FAD)